jgi:peptidoglycan/LPS O-acetylase OafA/YrhL
VLADKLLSDELFAAGFTAITAAALAAPARAGLSAAFGRLLAAVGRRAYGLYLVHQPALDWLALPFLARATLAVGGGLVFSRLFERPFERRAKQIGRVLASTA